MKYVNTLLAMLGRMPGHATLNIKCGDKYYEITDLIESAVDPTISGTTTVTLIINEKRHG
jgi:hypothetical protein